MNATPGRWIAGAGGALLIASLFFPWIDTGDTTVNGWELLLMADVALLIGGLIAITAALTGGRFGLFRPDLSLIGATDLLGLVSSVMIGWFVLFDFPADASREIGVLLALIGAMAMAGGAGDYSVLRGSALFPPTSR